MLMFATLLTSRHKWRDFAFALFYQNEEPAEPAMYVVYGMRYALDDLQGPSDCQWMIPCAR